jgi:hypothetical protein
MTVPQIVRVLLAEGVAKVIVTTEDRSRYKNINMPNGVAVLPRSRLDEAQRILASTRRARRPAARRPPGRSPRTSSRLRSRA